MRRVQRVKQPQRTMSDDRFVALVEEARDRKKRWANKELTEEEVRDLKQYWDSTAHGKLVYGIPSDEIQRVIARKDAAIGEEKRTRLIQTIEKGLNCRLDLWRRNEIIYFSERFLLEDKTSASKMRGELVALRRRIEHLAKGLESATFLTREVLKGEDTMRDDLFDHLTKDLQRMRSRVEKKLSILLKRRGGPNPNWALHAYVSYLGGLYEQHTKKRPGRWGGFYRFVRECLDCLKISLHSDHSIDNVIRKYTDSMKTHYK